MREKARKFISLFALAFTLGTLVNLILRAGLPDKIERGIVKIINPAAVQKQQLAGADICSEKQSQKDNGFLFVGCNGFF